MRHPAFVVAVLLSLANVTYAADWSGAAWIWNDAAALQGVPNDPVYFRTTVDLTDAPTAASLAITADNAYELHVNGQKVGANDSWNDVETYDVAKLLTKGKNVLAVKATNAGGAAGLIARLEAKLPDGKKMVLGTGKTWKTPPTEAEGWTKTDFDDRRWTAVAVLGDASVGPWGIAGGGSSGGGDRNVSDPKIREYRPASEEIAQFELPEGFKIELVAAEPLIINPVCIAVDEQNRLYVSQSHTYRFGPSGSPVKTPANPIVRLDPQPDGNFKRTLVAEGFDDPVMGMVIRNGQLWAAANNYLFRFDLTEAGLATNKTTLLVDKNKAWNPFGMFVLEWGPEGDLYMSVGNHNIDIGPEGQKNGEGISGRGGSGIVLRMKPDGTQLERLVHGLRVPYAFDIDPFGQHWQLSNGEGNPNRFVRVIEGVDYHCYSRPQVNNEWLAGRQPLAPPSFELPRGATTQLLRYYGANFPASYQGSLFLDNWGAHGFGGPNRTIFRYVPDARNNIETKEEFLVCRDPHFRCSHVLYAPDGSLLIADWYGRDDESDLTGRIWRVSYTGEGRPAVKHKLDAAQWKDEAYALSALGSPDHGIRTKAMETLAARGNGVIAPLSLVTKSGESLAAAHALWTLARIQTPESITALASGSEHADWRVRRQTLQLLKRYQSSALEAVCRALSQDADPAVRVMAASLLTQPTDKRAALIAALTAGAAADDHLRYEAAWHLADVADAATYKQMLASPDENLQHAGLITIDIAGYERRGSVDAAMQVLAEVLASPGELDQKLVLDLARLHDSPSLVDALRDLVRREDVPPAVTATALLMLRSKSADAALDRGAIARFLEAVKKGEVPVNSPTDQLTLLDLLESEGPTEFTIARLQTGISHNDKRVQEKAHRLARKFGTEAAALAPAVWNRLANPQQKNVDEKLELLTTLLAIQREPQVARWTELLRTAEGPLLVDIVRSWRQLGAQPELAAAMIEMTPKLLERNPSLQGDLPAVVAAWPTASDAQAKLKLAALPESVEAYKTAALSAKSANEAQWLGRRVFERTGCVKCHTALSQNTERAPSLQGIGKAQKIEYLMESILEPSTVIKTGYETETIVTKDGKVHAGLVKEQGDKLRIITADGETTIPKSEIEERAVQKKSLMPDGQHRLLSPGEFADLIVYLKSL